MYKQISWVESNDCEYCQKLTNQYNPKDSSTSHVFPVYAGCSAMDCECFGNITTDYMTLIGDGKKLLVKLNFTLASFLTGCSGLSVDGSLGLSRTTVTQGLPIVPYLKMTGQISNALFSLYINNYTETSKDLPVSTLTFGFFNLSLFASDPKSVFFVPIVQQGFKWSCYFTNLTFGEYATDDEILIVFDTTFSTILGEYSAYKPIITQLLLSGRSCVTEYFLMISCYGEFSDDLPGISVNYFNYTLNIPNHKIWSCANNNCTLNIQFNGANKWTFGLTFFNIYYTIFNYDNSSIGFALAKQPQKYSGLSCLGVVGLVIGLILI